MAAVTGAGQALVETFAQIRIINLRSRADRRREMGQELARLGLSLDHPQIALHEASRFDDAGVFPSIGARGCFHSHLAVLEEALASGAPSLLIFEDDLDFARNIETLLPAALDALRGQDWSFFYGGHERVAPGDVIRSGPIMRVEAGEPIRLAHFLGLRREAIVPLVPYLRAMLDRAPGSPDGGPMHVDGAYSWFRKTHPRFETWLAEPQLGHQRPSRTDIHQLGIADRTPVLRDLLALARRVKRRMRNSG